MKLNTKTIFLSLVIILTSALYSQSSDIITLVSNTIRVKNLTTSETEIVKNNIQIWINPNSGSIRLSSGAVMYISGGSVKVNKTHYYFSGKNSDGSRIRMHFYLKNDLIIRFDIEYSDYLFSYTNEN